MKSYTQIRVRTARLFLIFTILTFTSSIGMSVTFSAPVSAATPTTCEGLDALSDEEYYAIPDEVIDALCGVEEPEATDVAPAEDPAAYVDPCADIPEEQLDAMSDAEYEQKCQVQGEETTPTTEDEETDGGTTPESASTIPVATKGKGTKNVKINLANKTTCINSASQIPVKKLKAYGNDRVKSRKAILQKESRKIDKNYNKAKVSANLKSRQKSANKQLKKAAAKYKKRVSSVGSVKISTPANHRKQLKSEVKTQSKVLTTASKNLKKSKTSAQAAQATCSVIFDTQIASYLVPKIRAQKSIDNLYVQNAAYAINYQTAAKIAKLRGKPAPRITDPNNIKAQINALQGTLNNLNAQAAAAHVNNGGKASALFNSQLGGGKASVKSTISRDNAIAKKRVKAAL
jgi:hypothetical protein